MTEDLDDSFNASRAEVFEALGHPTRMRILKILNERPLGFSELKRETGIESGGLLTFHLGKLSGLVKLNSEGSYALTDEGREALRIIEASRGQHQGWSGHRLTLHLPHQRTVLAGLLVVLVVLGTAVVYQQQRFDALSSSQSRLLGDSTVIGGQRYWYVTMPFSAVSNQTSVKLDGVVFNFTYPSTCSRPTPTSGCIVTIYLRPTGNGVNMTVTPSLPTRGLVISGWTMPSIQVLFPDGAQETLADANVSSGANGIQSLGLGAGTTAYFTFHANPQAGFSISSQNDTVTLYVSVR